MMHRLTKIIPKPAWLAALSALYVFALIVSHASLPKAHVWIIATVFSVIMNAVYISSAFQKRRYISTEFLVALTLITLSLLGPILSPLF